MYVPLKQRICLQHFLSLTFSHSESDWEPDNLTPSCNIAKIDQLRNTAELQAVVRPGNWHEKITVLLKYAYRYLCAHACALDKNSLCP